MHRERRGCVCLALSGGMTRLEIFVRCKPRMQTVLWMSRISYLPGTDSNGNLFRRNKIGEGCSKMHFTYLPCQSGWLNCDCNVGLCLNRSLCGDPENQQQLFTCIKHCKLKSPSTCLFSSPLPSLLKSISAICSQSVACCIPPNTRWTGKTATATRGSSSQCMQIDPRSRSAIVQAAAAAASIATRVCPDQGE